METNADTAATVEFFRLAATELTGRDGHLAVLDFGCGGGELVEGLSAAGWTASGCDFPGISPQSEWFRDIQTDPYRLPFDDETFDLVLSTSVLEHAANKEQCFREIHRVLRPGGYAMHLFPSKWHLPTEPHIHVPLVSWFWPRCPRPWLALWALLGIRNEFQGDLSWREVVKDNARYSATGLSYWTTGQYERLSRQVFGDVRWPARFYVQHARGGAARLARRLPMKRVVATLVRETRESFLVQRKASAPSPGPITDVPRTMSQ